MTVAVRKGKKATKLPDAIVYTCTFPCSGQLVSSNVQVSISGREGAQVCLVVCSDVLGEARNIRGKPCCRK